MSTGQQLTSARNSDIITARGMAMIREALSTVVSHTADVNPEGNIALTK